MSSRATASSTTTGVPTTANTLQTSAALGRSFGQFMRTYLPQIVSLLRLALSNVFVLVSSLRQALLSGLNGAAAANKPVVVVKGA